MARGHPDFEFSAYVKTLAADNLMIDKLTQGGYTERRMTLSNNGVTPSWEAKTGDNRAGKFFPRGCRGYIYQIAVYCKDAGASGGTITVYITPFPGMGPLYSAVITVPAGGDPAWRNAGVNRMWEYDSLFIYVLCSGSEIQYGVDVGEPHDSHDSTVAGRIWVPETSRRWFRAVMYAATVGDVPISGMINTIPLPNIAAVPNVVSGLLDGGERLTIIDEKGAGTVRWFALRSAEDAGTVLLTDLTLLFAIDGVSTVWGLSGLRIALGSTTMQPFGICLTEYDNTDHLYAFAFEVPIQFRYACRIRLKNNAAAGNTTNTVAYIIYDMMR